VTLNAYAVAGDAAYGEGLTIAASMLADDGAFEFLDTFGGAFFDAQVYADHIARA